MSTGSLDVSATITVNIAAAAIKDESFKACRPLIISRLVDFAFIETANTARKITGSTRLEMNISLEDPIPPNGLAVSRPARDRKKRPRAKINIRRKKSPRKLAQISEENTGSRNAAAIADPKIT